MVRLRRALGTFLSTFAELHYFVSGVAVGFVVGFGTSIWLQVKRRRYQYEIRRQYR